MYVKGKNISKDQYCVNRYAVSAQCKLNKTFNTSLLLSPQAISSNCIFIAWLYSVQTVSRPIVGYNYCITLEFCRQKSVWHYNAQMLSTNYKREEWNRENVVVWISIFWDCYITHSKRSHDILSNLAQVDLYLLDNN